MSRDSCGPEKPPERDYSNANPGGWFGYAPLPNAGDPPDEVYSRVTNPERFQPLHEAALRLIERLRAEFDVKMSEGYDLGVPGIERDVQVRPSIRLSPNDSDCAPVTVVFTDFPGVRIWFGKWQEEPFPECGCDACDEDADVEIAIMTQLLESVTVGGVVEAIRIPRIVGDGWMGAAVAGPQLPETESERPIRLRMTEELRESANSSRVFSDDFEEYALTNLASVSEGRIERSKALEMTGGRLYVEYDWKPWPRRR